MDCIQYRISKKYKSLQKSLVPANQNFMEKAPKYCKIKCPTMLAEMML